MEIEYGKGRLMGEEQGEGGEEERRGGNRVIYSLEGKFDRKRRMEGRGTGTGTEGQPRSWQLPIGWSLLHKLIERL